MTKEIWITVGATAVAMVAVLITYDKWIKPNM